MQSVISQYGRVLVDMIDGKFDRGHDATANVTLRHVTSVGEKTGDIDVAFFNSTEVDRFLPTARQDGVEPQNGGKDVRAYQ